MLIMLYQFNSKRRGSAQEIKTSHATQIQALKQNSVATFMI